MNNPLELGRKQTKSARSSPLFRHEQLRRGPCWLTPGAHEDHRRMKDRIVEQLKLYVPVEPAHFLHNVLGFLGRASIPQQQNRTKHTTQDNFLCVAHAQSPGIKLE